MYDLLIISHPMLNSLSCMCSFLLGIVLCQHIYETHEVHLPLRCAWKPTQSDMLNVQLSPPIKAIRVNI